MRTIHRVLAALLAVCLSPSCQNIPGLSTLVEGAKADLIPLPAAGFCQDGGRLRVSIRNQDAGDADRSKTRVTFSRGSAVDLDTPPVDGGRIVTLDPIAIPPECFAPDCLVTVTVDSQGDVDESNEDNNVVEERCPAPST